jgi:predicted permease
MSTLIQDLRFGARVLLKTPAFSLTAILVLAVAIGSNAAVFSFVDALLLRPLVGRDRPGEVVGLYSRDRTRPDDYRSFSYANYADVRDRSSSFSGLAAFSVGLAGVREGEMTRRTLVVAVTSNYFATLGAGLSAGRAFTAEEERPGRGAAVAIVSDDYWRRHGTDRPAIGRSVWINARPFTIVGVAQPGFTGTVAVIAAEMWVPTGAWETVTNDAMRLDGAGALADRRNRALMVVGRLRPGVTRQVADTELRHVAAELERAFPAENRNQDLLVRPLSRLTLSTAPQSDWGSAGNSAIVMAMAAAVLLIAGMNLANMMMVRGAARRREIAMRLALGGGRGRIVRQLLTEGFLLSLAGGAAGLLVSFWGCRVLWTSLVALSPIPMHFDPVPDARVLGATLGFCALSTIVFCLAPALRLSRTDILSQLKGSGADPGGPRPSAWSGRNVLVVAQIALSFGLLSAAGLFMRGALNASTSDPGYRLDGRAIATIDPSLAGYAEPRGRSVSLAVLERLRRLPGVEAASLSSVVAFDTMRESRTVRPAGAGPDGRAADAVYGVVGRDYFRTLGLSLLGGRDFTAGEESDPSGVAVAIVDQALARQLFGADDPLGRAIEVTEEDTAAPRRLLVVGVAPGLRQSLWDKAPVAHVYLPSGQAYRALAHVHLHLGASARGGDALQAVRREIRAVDDRLPVLAVQTLAQHRNTTTTYWAVRAMAAVFSGFGALALLLAVTGVYGVESYVVAGRTREIGIRMALGSRPSDVLRLVLGDGSKMALGGLGVGLLIALGAGRLVGSVLYQINAFDPLVLAVAALALGGASLVACYVPARRATRISPTVALRAE